MLRYVRVLAVVLVAFATAACSSAMPAGAPVRAPDAAPDHSKKKRKAIVHIVIRHHNRRHRARVRAHYISVATKSIAIAVTPAGGGAAQNFNADLTPASNPDCIAGSGVTSCRLTIGLAPGNYTVKIATYDGLLAGGNAPNNPPTGNELSANQDVPLGVSLETSNELHVTLDGVPTGVTIVPGAGSTLSGTAVAGFALARCTSPAQNVNVYGIDADGSYIVGAGAPTPSLTSNDAANLPVTATPGPSSPNQFTLTPAAYPTKSGVVQLTAGVTPVAGIGASSQSAKIDVTFASTTCYSIAEYPAPSASPGPGDIAASTSNLWFTEGDSVAAITTTGTAIGTYAAGSDPVSLAFDGTNMWAVDGDGAPGSVVELSPSGATLGTYGVGNYPYGIAFDGTNMWIPNSGATTVTELSPTGATLGTYSAGSGPGAVAFDGTDMWVVNYGGGSVTKLSLAGATLGTYPVGNHPWGLGFDGTYMWVANYGDNTITQLSLTGSTRGTFTVPTVGGGPKFITKGSDGAMWFTEFDGNNIGRVASDGTFTEIPVPTSGSKPLGITNGPDGNIWFTERSGGKIGQVQAH